MGVPKKGRGTLLFGREVSKRGALFFCDAQESGLKERAEKKVSFGGRNSPLRPSAKIYIVDKSGVLQRKGLTYVPG